MKEKTQRPALVEACESENRRLKDDPNVLCVGFGLRRRGGKPEYEVCLVYHVFKKFKKVEEIESCGSGLIPKEMQGYPTDVVEVQEGRPAGSPTGDRGSRIENPLVGGTSTTVLSDWHSFPTGYGTLGGLCFDENTGEALALSNAHVWGMDVGKDVIQPWMPVSEYLEATIKLLACGPIISYILDTTVPSPLTAGLTAGAAAAYIASIASDMEDPSRWGQRVGPIPAANEKTEKERIHIESEIPYRPFAGRPYSVKTSWNYTRETTGGSLHQTITKIRKNTHTIIGKQVWTEYEKYNPGDRVKICAAIETDKVNNSEDYFVVAHCFPKSNPEQVIQRILTPGECKYFEKEETCIHGFQENHKPEDIAQFPFKESIFTFESPVSSEFHGPWPMNDPTGKVVLRIPSSNLKVTFPPSFQVRVEVFHTNQAIEIHAYDDLGQLVSSIKGSEKEDEPQILSLMGPNITQLILSGGGGEGFLVGICVDRKKEVNKIPTIKADISKRFVYTGNLDLDLHEPPGKWGITLFVQTVNNFPISANPIDSAKTIGGIMVSDNIVDSKECTCSLLIDHIFEVV
jgi:hypothetical protein